MPDFDVLPAVAREPLRRHWQTLHAAEGEAAQRLCQRLAADAELTQQLLRLWCASEYAANVVCQAPALVLALLDERAFDAGSAYQPAAALAERLRPFSLPAQASADLQLDEVGLKQTLRRFQQQQMLRLIWREVSGVVTLRQSCADISAVADAVLSQTLALLQPWCERQSGHPRTANGQAQSLVILAMGKYGAGELNLSSDIDLIFAYPEAGETQPAGAEAPITNQQFFTRLGQKLIDLIDTPTRDGFVYRVDMRLRPYGGDGALVCSFDAMENYYQAQGRDWERYAMIKARVVAGDHQAGKRLLLRLRPFVYRRYLDFSAFESLRDLKQQINKQVRRKGMAENIKLGEGGIREAEFIVQALQLVHGGRDESLQEPSLYAAMQALSEGEYLPVSLIEQLEDAYDFLRLLEHRLQGFANKQTQSLPRDDAQRQRIAFVMNFSDWHQLEEELQRHQAVVHRHYLDVIHIDEEEEAEQQQVASGALSALWQKELSDEAAVALLAQLGYESADETWAGLQQFRAQRQFLTLPAESRLRFNRFMPLLLSNLAEESTPSLGFSRTMKMVEAVARRTAYLVLLIENPAALRQFVRLCTASPFIADFLSTHPVLLDELLDGIDQPPEKTFLQDELRQQLLRIEADDFESQMEYLRYFKLSHTLQVAAAQITGKMTVMKVSDYLTFTAEAVLEQVLSLSWQHLVRKHGYPVNNQGLHGEMDFVVLGYGKLGGIELSYVSDLDLVFLHDGALDEDTRVTDEQRAINSREFYTRLAQRVITMLDTHTVSGRLYEVDMRLRPSGESGLLVSSLAAFDKYQHEDAWTWEHQALVRARPVAGSARLAKAFAELREAVLSLQREPQRLARDVLSMRARMRRELTRKAGRAGRERPPFVIKQGSGGIVDIEFIVQFLVLSQSHGCRALMQYSDNMRILEAVQANKLLPADTVRALMEAYLALRATLHRFALQENDLQRPLAELQGHRELVRRAWQALFAPWLDPSDPGSPT